MANDLLEETKEEPGWLNSITSLPGYFYDFVTSTVDDPYADMKPRVTVKREEDRAIPEHYDNRNPMPPASRTMPGPRDSGRHRLNPRRERGVNGPQQPYGEDNDRR